MKGLLIMQLRNKLYIFITVEIQKLIQQLMIMTVMQDIFWIVAISWYIGEWLMKNMPMKMKFG